MEVEIRHDIFIDKELPLMSTFIADVKQH